MLKLIESAFSCSRTSATVLLGGSIVMVATSCSYQSIYRNIQEDGRRRCEEIPIAQQATCKARYQTNYEEYNKIREQLKVEARLEEFENP